MPVKIGSHHKEFYSRGSAKSCWEWKGAVNLDHKGRVHYGRIRLVEGGRSRTVHAHRWVYEREVGPIPNGKELDHTCKNLRCVNPNHLDVVDHLENVRRGNVTKLTLKQVEEIRSRYPRETGLSLAREFKVHHSTIYKITSGKNWVK